MSRGQLALAGLLVVQIVLIGATRGPLARSSAPGEPTALLPALESITPSKLEIFGPADERVTLLRDGSHWTVQDAGGYPADDQKVQGLIDKLKEVKVRRPVVTSPRYHQALKVTDQEHERRVRIWDQPSGNAKTGVYLGTSPNYRITHVRREGDDRVYEVTGLGVFDVQDQASGWIKTRLIETEPAVVTKIAVENAHGRFVAEIGDQGGWQVTAPAARRGKALDRTKVEGLIRAATGLSVSEPAGALDRKAQGLERPSATITLTAGSPPSGVSAAGNAGGEVALMVGGKVAGQDNKRYVTRSGFDHAAIVYESAVDKLIGQKLDDLY